MLDVKQRNSRRRLFYEFHASTYFH